MFCKFLFHDLRTGLADHKGRFLISFFLFFSLSTYHFFTLRIYELTNPEFFNSPVTTADYFLALVGGCGKVEQLPGGGTTFTMPVLWLVFVLWMQFASLYYPFADLNGIGKNLLCLSGQRNIWWFSKCLWTVCSTLTNYLVAVLASWAAGLCLGAMPSMEVNIYLFQELKMNWEFLTSETTWNILPVFVFLPLILTTLALLQLALSVVLKPLFSYLLLAGMLVSGTYVQSPVLLGNFAMPARNSLLTTSGLSPVLGIILCLWVVTGSVLLGRVLFEKMDLLEGEQI